MAAQPLGATTLEVSLDGSVSSSEPLTALEVAEAAAVPGLQGVARLLLVVLALHYGTRQVRAGRAIVDSSSRDGGVPDR